MHADIKHTPAVILSGNLGKASRYRGMNEIALALVRSLGRHGVPVYRLHPDRSLADLSSRYCMHLTCPNLYDDPSGLLNELLAFAGTTTGRPVLFPASDGAALFIADNEQELGRHFALTCPSSNCIMTTQNKRCLLETAQAFGIPIPETYFPAKLDDVKEISSRHSHILSS